MRVFKFWRVAETTAMIRGTEKTISCFGGSNRSEADAVADGQRRLEAVKRRIAGIDKGKGKGLDYEADIREEPIKWIGDQDVVTRNRYGAEVLNTTSFVFVDIDEPVFAYGRSSGAPVRANRESKPSSSFSPSDSRSPT